MSGSSCKCVNTRYSHGSLYRIELFQQILYEIASELSDIPVAGSMYSKTSQIRKRCLTLKSVLGNSSGKAKYPL